VGPTRPIWVPRKHSDMSLKKISWTNYFTTDPPLPFDVAFNIIEGGRVTEQILAHRYLLATCSSVFCTQFFGLLAEKRRIIPIQETTGHAFNFLLQYIYGFSLNYEEFSVDQLFEILNLAERYDIAVLREQVTAKLAELLVLREEVIEVARVALAYSHFETASNSVLLTCSRILKKNQESRAPLQFPHDEALVAHLLSREEPVPGDEDELGCALHDLFNEKGPPRLKVATPPQNLTSVNWMDLLEPTSRIPADVSFKIIERPNNNEGEGEEKVKGEVRAHKYYLATVSDTFKSLFFGTPECQSCHTEALDYCDNKSFNLCEEGSIGVHKFKMRSEESIEGKEEFEGEWKAVSKQICDRGGGGGDDDMNQNGVEDIKVVCSSVGAFQVMIDYLYGKFPTLRGAEEICEIFEIVDLAERFKVVGLEDEYRTAMFLYFRERPRWNSSPVTLAV